MFFGFLFAARIWTVIFSGGVSSGAWLFDVNVWQPVRLAIISTDPRTFVFQLFI
jgi:hypothetical protein